MVGGTSGFTGEGNRPKEPFLYKMEADGYDRRTAHSTACADDYDHGARGWKRKVIRWMYLHFIQVSTS